METDGYAAESFTGRKKAATVIFQTEKNKQRPTPLPRARSDQKHPLCCFMPVVPRAEKLRGVMFVIVWQKPLNHFQAAFLASMSRAPVNVNKPLETGRLSGFLCAQWA